MNIKKMTAYQIAELNQNEEGLKLLMKYELKIKEKDYINISALNSPVQSSPENTCKTCFWNCIFKLFNQDKANNKFETQIETQTNRNLTKTPHHLQELGIFEIQWKKPKAFNN